MPRSTLTGAFSSPKVDLVVDMGNPFLNLTVDGFLKIDTVAAAKVGAEEGYHLLKRGSVYNPLTIGDSDVLVGNKISHRSVCKLLKKMCKEGAYWGTVAGVYVGLEYGVERIRGTRDWALQKNAMIGGALTGALVSAATNNNNDKIVMDAIAGGAVATAADFLNCLT
ncbi:Outer envelope pore protein 16, chloroplastic [Orobanche gracilis]